MSLENKFRKLKEYLKSLNTTAIAFSSGVDSTFLLKTAHEVLGEGVIALTAKSSIFPERELDEAIEFCKKEHIEHVILDFEPLQIEEFYVNPANRCYVCKKNLYKQFIKIAREHKIEHILEGSNIDDERDYRPGMQAVRELGIKSPLQTVQLTKDEIRILSQQMNLHAWEKPSYACLASRFVYGEHITEEKLKMVEKAEQLLFESGFKQMRVRIHENIARIEVMPEEFEKLMQLREKIVSGLKKYGFNYITMDLTGYRTGSMNETLDLK